MFARVTIRARDLAASERFDRTVLDALGLRPTHERDGLIAWDDFAILAAGESDPPTRHLHVAFTAGPVYGLDPNGTPSWCGEVSTERVRRVDPPDSLIGAGAIATAVWHRLHGYATRTPLAGGAPVVPEEVRLRGRALASSAAAIATFPKTAVCVGMRRATTTPCRSKAPFDLGDLFGLIHRRNPARVSVEEYERRLAPKRITERWPRQCSQRARHSAASRTAAGAKAQRRRP